MCKWHIILLPVCFYAQSIVGQTSMREEFDNFLQQSRKEFADFRAEANAEYAGFLRQAWKEYNAEIVIPLPEEKPVPPVVIDGDERQKPVEDDSVRIDVVVEVPKPEPQPTPVSPVREEPVPAEPVFTFCIYGTDMNVRLDATKLRFLLKSVSSESIAQMWEKLADGSYDNLLADCLRLRKQHRLCDWGYLRMLDILCGEFLGDGSNEAVLLKAYLYCQSGYKMRLATDGNRLYMLYACNNIIYEKPCWMLDGIRFYADGTEARQLSICGAKFPNEQAMSLYVPDEQLLDSNLSEKRLLKSSEISADVAVNRNVLAFCDDYPSSQIGSNPVTRWAMYANAPLGKAAAEQLYPVLAEKIKGQSQLGAVNKLLNWVQTAFAYEYDDKVWGGDRAFFCEETLYYPYCDCEDRAILLSRIVRDLLGLDVILVYYPGHLAMAVSFTEEVRGDYIMLDGKRYVIADPTYIGAPVGKTMPGMDNKSAIVVKLR